MPIKKTIDIEVDSSKLEKASKTTIKIDNTTKSILETNKAIFDTLSKLLAKDEKSIQRKEKEVKSLEKQKKILLEIEKIKQREANRLKEYNKNKAKEDLQSQIEKRELEKPKMGFLERYQKYKGLAGGITRFGEKAAEEGQKKIDVFNQELLTKDQERGEALEELQKAQKAREDLESKGVYDPKSKKWKKATQEDKEKADKAIEAAQSGLEQKDKEIRETERARSKQIGENKTQANKYAAMASAAARADAAISKLGKAATDLALKPFRDLKEAVVENVTAMLDLKSGLATFSTSTSLITNASARESQMKYGLTAAQNYAFTQAKSMLGIQSDEDLMYMNADQRDRLLSYMERYSNWYEELESSGVLSSIQEMQLEFEELKQELAMEFLSWVAENKDTIMMCIKGIFEFIKSIANFVMSIINLLGGQGNNYDLYDAATASDNINNNNNSRNTNITINANTTNNATGVLGSQEALDNFNEENWSKLAKQVVGAIGG